MALATSGIGGVDRIPPNNLEAEMAVIGSILVDREMMAPVGEILSAADFYAHVHETIFTALVQLYERGEPLDKITLAEELRLRNLLEKVGGLPYLTSLMDTVPTAASAEYYAQIVREKASLRGLIHAGTEITKIGFENEEDVEGALDRSEQIVYEVGRRQKNGQFAPIYKLLKGTFEQIDRLYHSRGNRTGLTSGFTDIDEYTAGFQPGNFIILAARPAMGKTSMALDDGRGRGERRAEADRRLLARNDERRARHAPALRRSAHQLAESPPRQHQRPGVGEDLERHERALAIADLHRRFGYGHGQRDPQPLPPFAIRRGPLGRFHRLLAARSPVGARRSRRTATTNSPKSAACSKRPRKICRFRSSRSRSSTAASSRVTTSARCSATCAIAWPASRSS